MNQTIEFTPKKKKWLRTNTHWPPDLAAFLQEKAANEFDSDINETLRAVIRQVWLSERHQEQSMAVTA